MCKNNSDFLLNILNTNFSGVLFVDLASKWNVTLLVSGFNLSYGMRAYCMHTLCDIYVGYLITVGFHGCHLYTPQVHPASNPFLLKLYQLTPKERSGV